MKDYIIPISIRHGILLLFILCFGIEVTAQGPFYLRQDSVGFPSRQMEITEYYPNGKMSTHTRTYSDDGPMGNHVEDYREFFYYADGNIQYDLHYSQSNMNDGEWNLQYRLEYEFDEAGNTTLFAYREWNDDTQEWAENPFDATIKTFDGENKVLTEEYKDNFGISGYQTRYLRTFSYDFAGQISEVLLNEYSVSIPEQIISQTKDQYNWPDPNTAMIERDHRNSINSSYTHIEDIMEVYEDGRMIEQTTSEISGWETLLTKRLSYFYSEQGFSGGFRRENYVNGQWQLHFDNVTTFDEYGNRVSAIARDFNDDTQSIDVTWTQTAVFDTSILMENCMAPFNRNLPTNSPIHKPLYETHHHYENSELIETREFIYYYSDVVVSTIERSPLPNLIMYPNPSRESIRFSLDGSGSAMQIRIVSSDGKLVKAERILPMESLDISDLTSGIYHCLIIMDGVVATETLVVP